MLELYKWRNEIVQFLDKYKDEDVVIADPPNYIIMIPEGDGIFKLQANSYIEEVNQLLTEYGYNKQYDYV